MKYIFILVTILLGACSNQAGKQSSSTGSGGSDNSKYCQILKDIVKCSFDAEDSGDPQEMKFCSEKIALMAVVGTEYDNLVDDLLDNKITGKEFVDSIPKKDLKEFSWKFHKKHRDILNPETSFINALHDFEEYYNCG